MKYNGVHDHCTCEKSHLHTQFCRTTLFKNNSANVGIKLYNKLPNTIKRLHKIQEFKRRLKYFFLQHIFYSVDEYMSSQVPLLLNYLLLCTLYSKHLVIPPNTILKNYTLMCMLIRIYITVFHYWCKCIESSFCYVYCVWMFLCNVGTVDWALCVRCHICDWMDWMEEYRIIYHTKSDWNWLGGVVFPRQGCTIHC
jgi:hypothetical protein